MGELQEQDLSKNIGKRVDYQGYQGTIKYVGPVHSTSGTWLGIDWDDPTRGKHDGSHGNVQYFKTSFPTSGSFVRANKVHFGVSFLEALKEKYIEGAHEQQLIEDVLEVLPRRKCQLRDRKEICLERCCIADAEASAEGWQQLGQNFVESLFLSCNLIPSWSVVAEICGHFPCLRKLVLSSNRLELPDDPMVLASAFSSISILALNKMAYEWTEVQRCLTMFPHLEELDLSANRIDSLELPHSAPWTSTLHCLDLSYNPLQGWKQLVKLGSLPNLQVLSADSVGLAEIELLPGDPPLFPALSKLFLSNNCLSRWEDVAQLSRLPRLQELTLQANPVWAGDGLSVETCKQLAIAKLPHLTFLNKMKVTAKERREAEFDYIKRYFRAWLSSGGTRDPKTSSPDSKFLAEHPTFPKLLTEHNAPEDSELENRPKNLKNSLISVEIFCPQNKGLPIPKVLPQSMAVGKVKMLVKRLIRIPSPSIALSYTCNQGTHEIEMDNDLKEIGFYSIGNGDRILVRW